MINAPCLCLGAVKSYEFDTRSYSGSVRTFPDFPLCIMPEKVKKNDFPIFLRQSEQGSYKVSVDEDNSWPHILMGNSL